MTQPGTALSLAASLRLPNVPSVWSNTLTGALLALLVLEGGDPAAVLPILFAATCLYLAGNLLNDWADRDWDAEHRPERALPRGLCTPSLYLAGSILLLAAGMGAAAVTSLPALATAIFLSAFILLYTWLHKRTAWSVIPMALCRACLPVLGFCACAQDTSKLKWSLVPAGLLFVYLVMLSLRARSESRGEPGPLETSLTAVGLLAPPLMLGAFWYFPHHWSDALLACAAAALPYLLWMTLTLTIFRRPIPRQVCALLAGIPLVDGLFLLPYVVMGHIPVPFDALGLALCFLWLAAFILGRLLQRFIPAT